MQGRPLVFKCAKCVRGERATFDGPNPSGRPVVTGKLRGTDGNTRVSAEYTCEVCGHKGWSTHPTMVRKARALGAEQEA